MKHPIIAVAIAVGLVVTGLLVLLPSEVKAHEQETSVDWVVAYENLQTLAPPVYTHYITQNLPLGGTRFAYSGDLVSGAYRTIPSGTDPGLTTGDYIVVTWSFRYVANVVVRGDLFWITRLGLDFATIGRYIDGNWIGSSSFEMVPGTSYDATLVLRSIQPTFRHLHVGVSVQNVGNIPAAPTFPVTSIPAGGPILYGVFTDANGPVVEPLQGVTVGGSPFAGTFILLAPWPWAVASLVGQIVIGFAFIGVMYWYGRWEQKRGAKA